MHSSGPNQLEGVILRFFYNTARPVYVFFRKSLALPSNIAESAGQRTDASFLFPDLAASKGLLCTNRIGQEQCYESTLTYLHIIYWSGAEGGGVGARARPWWTWSITLLLMNCYCEKSVKLYDLPLQSRADATGFETFNIGTQGWSAKRRVPRINLVLFAQLCCVC